MAIVQNIKSILEENNSHRFTLVAVSKTKPISAIEEAYEGGQRIFGENKVQELTEKHEALPKDIEWHMIGHLQSNKVKFIAPYVALIHGVDSLKLLQEINKQALKNERTINCLLQVHIAQEESKFGFDFSEIENHIAQNDFDAFTNIKITGLMGMATNTEDENLVRKEFRSLTDFFQKLKSSPLPNNFTLQTISMGMSGDYKIALDEGSNMVRIGSTIFGDRNYEQ